MTRDELRDALAVEMGWSIQLNSYGNAIWHHKDDHLGMKDRGHPFPDTIDAAAAAMPKGFAWTRHGQRWWLYDERTHIPGTLNVPHSNCVLLGHFPDTGDERYDRFALALACRRAERKEKV